MPRLYDCVSFFNELDLLEMRLVELSPVVDRFVIVEATKTHSGQDKPLYYAENSRRFLPWCEKIIHIVVGDMPEGDGRAADRRREMHQRNCILRGLMDAPDDALVLISDCDELPRLTHLPNAIPDGCIAAYDQTLYYYNFNTRATNLRWRGTRAANIADVRALSPHVIRYGLGTPDAHYPRHAVLENAGWHFSYFGGVEKIQQKKQAFLHQELVNDIELDAGVIAARISAGVDVWGRGEQKFTIGPADDLPDAVLAQLDKFSQYFAPGWQPTYHEDWYDGGQAVFMARLAQQVPEGAIVEIGAWEGRSTAILAQKVAPKELHVVDHWKGNIDEGEDHPAAQAARERDVFVSFAENMGKLTAGNYTTTRCGWQEWIERWSDPIAFLHLDAAHDRASVRDCLEAVKPFLVPGAVLCGDDSYSTEVFAGVRDVFPTVVEFGKRLWVVQYGND